MTSPAWDRAVGAGAVERSGLREICLYYSSGHDGCCCSGTPHNEAAQDAAFLRAALPHLLRATCEALDPQDMESMRLTFQTYLGGANVYPAGYDAIGRALLAALTDAAGRVGG